VGKTKDEVKELGEDTKLRANKHIPVKLVKCMRVCRRAHARQPVWRQLSDRRLRSIGTPATRPAVSLVLRTLLVVVEN
jgi:hypothetical protein